MGSTKKTFLAAKLSALSQALATFKTRHNNIWHFCKQVWYVPFLWSLAWYSYWIFHSLIVSGNSLAQVNQLNYAGAAVSITALLAAGYNFGKARKQSHENGGYLEPKLKKIFSLLKFKKENISQEPHIPQDTIPTPQEPKSEQTKTQNEPDEIIQNDQVKEPQSSPKPPQTPSTNTYSSQKTAKINQPSKTLETASDCLTCPNLVTCTHRKERTNESEEPCPYAS